MVIKLDSPQPVFSLPGLDVPDEDEDRPANGSSLSTVGSLGLSEIVFGAAALSTIYNKDEHLSSFTPVRTVRLALRYGVNAFDTSAYYGESEIVLGTALKALEVDFPRSAYKLMTKCGRYGSPRSDFDYSPATLRASIQRSLKRLNTTYLDAVYLHDVEFVATQVGPREDGHPTDALKPENLEKYGLADGQESKVWGDGDQLVLDGLVELQKMKDEGIVKAIGITGYPLPTLLRLALLVLHTAPYKPLDVLLSYSHLTLQNSAFAEFAPLLRERARVGQLLTASPLNMGLLTPNPPKWHPAPPELKEAVKKVEEACADWDGRMVNIAVGYGYRKAAELSVPMVAGLSNPREVHESMRAWRDLKQSSEKRIAQEQKAFEIFDGYQGWSWASPPDNLL
ncbi:NADP-dependent oxidoreductase domain-containing protein [Rhodofomes roseus]|uniref:NADP-dependent oxidoreductase domain-containing protein n=1 Tax=Rhodofomes roseus TaxID=34475 RepID=A0ABQ8KXF4_9APHY|nr:NADP-dependent oxidoreductase domain-containing protein [Rhodofomes roseus]KAH9843713.1 NADP-dependent oxidoreductase domain-containing protein [Rhodofomes roseus]